MSLKRTYRKEISLLTELFHHSICEKEGCKHNFRSQEGRVFGLHAHSIHFHETLTITVSYFQKLCSELRQTFYAPNLFIAHGCGNLEMDMFSFRIFFFEMSHRHVILKLALYYQIPSQIAFDTASFYFNMPISFHVHRW